MIFVVTTVDWAAHYLRSAFFDWKSLKKNIYGLLPRIPYSSIKKIAPQGCVREFFSLFIVSLPQLLALLPSRSKSIISLLAKLGPAASSVLVFEHTINPITIAMETNNIKKIGAATNIAHALQETSADNVVVMRVSEMKCGKYVHARMH